MSGDMLHKLLTFATHNKLASPWLRIKCIFCLGQALVDFAAETNEIIEIRKSDLLALPVTQRTEDALWHVPNGEGTNVLGESCGGPDDVLHRIGIRLHRICDGHGCRLHALQGVDAKRCRHNTFHQRCQKWLQGGGG